MSRMDQIEIEAAVLDQTEAKPGDLQWFMTAGNAAKWFLIWAAMAIPVLLVIDLRF